MSDGALKLVGTDAPVCAPLPADAPKGLTWIPLAVAAERSKLGVGTLRNKCLSQWGPPNGALAKQGDLGNGQTGWLVHESADVRFQPVKTADQQVTLFDQSKLTARQRDTYNFRIDVLRRWDEACNAAVQMGMTRNDATERFCEHLKLENITLSRSTIYGWDKKRRLGPEHLVDGRTTAAQETTLAKADNPFLQEVARLWLRQSRPKIKTCYDYAVRFVDAQPGIVIPSLKTAERYLKSLPQDLVIRMRGGETAYTNLVLPHVKRRYEDLASNDWWCSDHHQFDVVVEIGRDREGQPVFARPWLTVWQDLRSRRIVAWSIYAHAPNQTTILQTFRAAALALGIPHHVLIDNGKDYDCYTLQGMTKWQRRKLRLDIDTPSRGVMGNLQVRVHHALPYKARSKPVERFFGTLCTRFSKFVPCYCGRNPQERPEEHLDLLKAGAALTLSDFTDQFDAWLEGDYHTRNHEGSGLDGEISPVAAYGRFFESKRSVSREALELLIQRTSEPLSVTANGVTFDKLVYGLDQRELLAPYFGRGKQVYLRVDPDDVTRASCWTLDDDLIGVLTLNGAGAFLGPTSDAEIRRVKNTQKRLKQVTRQYHEEVLGNQHLSLMDLAGMQKLADARAKKVPQLPAPAPTSMRLVTDNPAEQQARQLQDYNARRALLPAPSPDPAAADPGEFDLLAAADAIDIDDVRRSPHAPAQDDPEIDLLDIFNRDGGLP